MKPHIWGGQGEMGDHMLIEAEGPTQLEILIPVRCVFAKVSMNYNSASGEWVYYQI